MTVTKAKQSKGLATNALALPATAKSHLWQKGQSANPLGRPIASRERLTKSFMDRLADSFDKHGKRVLDQLAQKDPGTYVRVIASLMPKQVSLDAGPLADLGQAELEALANAARKAVELASD
jgi:hypothetical protein